MFSFGFTERVGSGSDISVLGPVFGVCAANLSVGYKFAHSEKESLCFEDLLICTIGTKRIVEELTKEGTRWELRDDYENTLEELNR